MGIKIVVIIFLLMIIGSLGYALYRLARERNQNREDAYQVVRALTWRIGLSLLLFFLLILAYYQGWIHPHEI